MGENNRRKRIKNVILQLNQENVQFTVGEDFNKIVPLKTKPVKNRKEKEDSRTRKVPLYRHLLCSSCLLSQRSSKSLVSSVVLIGLLRDVP